jgi:hypothetical protein
MLKDIQERAREAFDKLFFDWWKTTPNYIATARPTDLRKFLDQQIAQAITQAFEEVKGKEKRICNNGGLGHQHNPFDCRTDALCEYCQHIEKRECENNGESLESITAHNQAVTEQNQRMDKFLGK